MSTPTFDTAKLRSLIKLAESRDSLLAELGKIESAISDILSTQNAPVKVPGKRGRKARVSVAPSEDSNAAKAPKAAKRKGRRGGVKNRILGALKEVGPSGISVKDLAQKLGTKPANLHVWFSTTGKTVGVEKVAPGIYRLK